MNFQLLIFLTNLVLIIVFFSLVAKNIKTGFKKLEKNTLVLLFLIFLIGFALRIPLPPSHIMTDEYYYMEAAKNILRTGEPVLCQYIDAGVESCSLIFKPLLFPFLLSLSFLFLGVNSSAAISVSVVAGTLSIILIFFLARLLFGGKETGLWSALLLALNPLHITWSKTAETNVTSLFLTLLIFVLFLFYFRVRDRNILLLGLFTTVFAVNLRPENGMLLVLVFLLFCLFGPDTLKMGFRKMRGREFWVWGAALVIMLVPYSIFLFHVLTTGEGYICSGGKCYPALFSLEAVRNNWGVYGLFSLFSFNFHPLILSLLVLVSFLFMKKRLKEFVFLWVFFLFFYSVVLANHLVHIRYLIPLYLTLTVLAGFSLSQVRVHVKEYTKSIEVVVFLILIVASFFPYIMRAEQIEPASFLETNLSEMVEKDVKEGCYVVAENPSVLNSKRDIRVVRAEYATEHPETLNRIIKNSNCVFLLADIFYRVSWKLNKVENFNKINRTYKLSPYKAYSPHFLEFQLYNVTLKQ